MSDFVCNAPTEQTQGKICDCHRKLVQFGIPLYIYEENDSYSEESKTVIYEKAFRLPGKLAIDEEVTEYLRVEDNDLPIIFEQMAEVFPTLSDYEENVLSFWILDVLIEGLWTAQSAKMSFAHQKATLMWIAYFINYIQEENPSRKKLFRHLKMVLFQNANNQCLEEGTSESLDGCTRTLTENFVPTETHWSMPLPPNVYLVQSKSREASKEKFSGEVSSSAEDYHSEEGSNTLSSVLSADPNERDVDRNVSDMKIILEILFRIFARVYAYQNIQTVFNMMPSLEIVHLPFPLKIPKPLAKSDLPGLGKSERSGKKSISDKCVDELDPERQLIKNNYILPLEVSEEAKEYLKQHSSDRSVGKNKEDKQRK